MYIDLLAYRAAGRGKARLLGIVGGLLGILAVLSVIAVKYAQKPSLSLLIFVFVVVVGGHLGSLGSLLKSYPEPASGVWWIGS